jgi:hypothetical protein
MRTVSDRPSASFTAFRLQTTIVAPPSASFQMWRSQMI